MCEGGGDCPKYLKRGVEKKRGGTKNLKRGDKISHRVGALKKGGLCTFMAKCEDLIPGGGGSTNLIPFIVENELNSLLAKEVSLSVTAIWVSSGVANECLKLLWL